MKKRILIGVLGLLTAIPFWAQQPLTLDSCRQMALRNNKQLRMAEAKINAAHYNRKAAFTAYLPGIDVTGGYIYNSREISLLNDNLKNSLPQMGTALSQSLTEIAATNPALGQLGSLRSEISIWPLPSIMSGRESSTNSVQILATCGPEP